VLTPLKLDFSSSDSKRNLPKYTTPHSTPATLFATLTLSLMDTSLFQTRSHLSRNPVIYHIHQLRCIRPYLNSKAVCTIATSASIVHSKPVYCNSLYYNLPLVSDNRRPTHPEFSHTCCCQNSEILSYYSHPCFSPRTFILSILVFVFMAALRSRCGHYIFVLFLLFFLHRLISAVAEWMSTILRHMMWS